jgi:hypothetical protein
VLQSTFASASFEPYRKPMHHDQFLAETVPVVPRAELRELLPA